MISSTRRGLIQGASSLAVFAALSRSRLARGATRAEDAHFFLFLQIHGAWDVCLGCDPKDREARLPGGDKQFDQPYAFSEVKDYGNGILLAPDAAPLGKFADRMAVINGIDMEADNGHIDDAVMSGFRSPRAANLPYVQGVLAKRHPYLRRCSIPHLFGAYDDQFFAGPYATSSLTATPGDFLALIGDPNASSGAGALSATQTMLGEFRASPAGQSSRRDFDGYLDATSRALQIGARLREAGFHAPSTTDTAEGTGNLLGQLFAAGALGAATLSFGSGKQFGTDYFFDTHADHYAKHPLKAFMADAAALCDALAGVPLDEHTSVLERTTVVVTAEFSRTPRLNAGAGKDHNIRSNSVILLGHRVKPGVFGASGSRTIEGQLEGHAGLPIDLATGKESADGKTLHIANVWAGMSGLTGVDLSHEFGPDTATVGFLG